MECIGLLGGMSWESTLDDYRLFNQGIRQQLSGQHSFRILLHTVDFAEIKSLQANSEREKTGKLLPDTAQGLQAAGTEAMLIRTNLMHKVAPALEDRMVIPLLHIADVTGKAIQARRLKKVGRPGASYTMEEGFNRQRL